MKDLVHQSQTSAKPRNVCVLNQISYSGVQNAVYIMEDHYRNSTKAKAERTEQGITMDRNGLAFQLRCSRIFSKPTHAAF